MGDTMCWAVAIVMAVYGVIGFLAVGISAVRQHFSEDTDG